MTGYAAISATDSIANDSMALKALYAPNYYQLLAAQQTQQAQQLLPQVSTVQDTTQTLTALNPSFQGAYTSNANADSDIGAYAAGAVAVLGAAALTFAAYKKGGSIKNIPEGFKQMGKSAVNLVKGLVVKGEKNIVKQAGKNLTDFTINKDGVQVLMKDGNPVKIITRDKQTLKEASKISEWLKDNKTINDMISKLDVSGKLPKGVSLAYTKEVKDGKNIYKMFVENGKVVKAQSKDRAGKWVEVAEDQLQAFMENHSSQVKEAETLTKTLKNQTVRLADGTKKKGKLTMSVRYGEYTPKVNSPKVTSKPKTRVTNHVVEAFIDGQKLNERELELLQKDFASQISQFGKENGSVYGLKDFDFIYKTRENAKKGIIGGQQFRFSTNVAGHTGTNWVTNANVTGSRTLTGAEEIKQFLEKNTGINAGIEAIKKGNTVDGFWLSNAVIASNSGNKYLINPNTKKVLSIELADGTVKKGADLSAWCKIAENKNEYDKILSQIN